MPIVFRSASFSGVRCGQTCRVLRIDCVQNQRRQFENLKGLRYGRRRASLLKPTSPSFCPTHTRDLARPRRIIETSETVIMTQNAKKNYGMEAFITTTKPPSYIMSPSSEKFLKKLRVRGQSTFFYF